MIKVGIVGCGGVAQVHAAVLNAIGETKLCACADVKPERAAAMAEKYGCRAYTSLEEMLSVEQLDAVHLCTPHYLHTPMAETLAAHGIAVFTEKPPAMNRAQWTRLKALEGKVPIGICFQNRYNQNTVFIKQLIADGTYGRVLGARAFVTWSRGAGYYQDSDWRGRWDTEGGGALINQAVHTLDLLVWLLGRPDRVEAALQNHHLRGIIEVEDTAEIYMDIGCKPVLLYATTAYAQNSPVMIEFELEKATLRLEDKSLEIRTPAGVDRHVFTEPETLGKGYWGNGHLPCISDFYASLRERRAYQNDIGSVENTIEALVSIYEQGKVSLHS